MCNVRSVAGVLLILLWAGWGEAGQVFASADASDDANTAENATSTVACVAGEQPAQFAQVLTDPGISHRELEIRLVPLTQSELAALSTAWLAMVKAKAVQMMEAQLAATETAARVGRNADRRFRLLPGVAWRRAGEEPSIDLIPSGDKSLQNFASRGMAYWEVCMTSCRKRMCMNATGSS